MTGFLLLLGALFGIFYGWYRLDECLACPAPAEGEAAR